MPSPATRSGRLIAKQSQDEKDKESKDDANKRGSKTTSSPSKPPNSPTKGRKPSGNKSPRLLQEAKERPVEKIKKLKQNQDESKKTVSSENVPEEKESKEVASEQLGTDVPSPDISDVKDKNISDRNMKKSTSSPAPASTLRRSSRAPVLSSRFKDMELGLTPNSQKMKRLLDMSPSGDSDVSCEPSPKRSKKNSNKTIEASPKKIEKEEPIVIQESDKKDDTLKQDSPAKDVPDVSVKTTQEENKNKIPIDENDQDPEAQILQLASLKSNQGSNAEGEEVLKENENKIGETEEMEVVTSSSGDLTPKDNMKVMAVSSINEEFPLEKVKANEESALLPPDLAVNTLSIPVEPTPQEITVEEVGLSCHDAGMIVEETVHTYMDEKDVVVIQNSSVSEDPDSVKEADDVHSPKELELSTDKESSGAIPSSIMIKGQEVTVQERDGKMVAIVKLPAGFDGHFSSPSTSETNQAEKITEYSVSSSLKNVTLNAPPSQKNRHGYILNKKTEKQQFVTITDQDHSTLNISLEPTTVSSILKSKPDSLTKTSPKSLYGRVIKQEPVIAKTNAETSVIQNTPSPNLIIKNAGSSQKISLLSHSIKATNPKDSKPYSLLSSPSELLQKLKSESEKKQASKIIQEPKKAAQLSSPPKKVVIITHPPKSDTQVEKTSVSSIIINSLNEDGIQVESGKESSEPLSPADTILTPADSDIKSGSQNEQNELPQIPTTEVVEEVATENDLVDDSNKVEEIVPQIFQESGKAELNVPDEKSQNPPCDLSTLESGNDVIAVEDENKTKELISESIIYESGEGDDVTSNVLISHDDKSAVEETVITSSSPTTEVKIKEEVGIETEDPKENKSMELAVVEKEKVVSTGTPKTQKIKLVDNGVVYELQIVSEGENRSFQDETLELEGVDNDAGMIVKQEIIDDGASTSSETVGKSSLGTQTIFTSKRGRPKVSGDKEDSDSPVHKLATIVQEGGQKKHYYYVSVVPGKTMDGKYRRSVDHSLPGCVVNDIGEYCCKECDYKTDKKANFYKHRRLHTGSKPHVCQVCKYQARTSSNLKRHMGIHEDIREFECNQCSLSFRQKIHLERHIRYRHEEKRVKCPMCDYVCANEQPDLKMHIKRKHTQESGKVFTCPQCNIEVGSKRDLKQHLKFHKDGPELKLFCKECSFVTDCKSRLQRHLVVHSNVKPYHCGVCDYKATQKEHVVRHLRSQHKIEVNKPKRPWKKQIKQEASETIGGNSRGDFTCGDKIFACNHCTMRFAKLINLYKHLHTQHSDIMPAETESNYYCVVCEFSTTSKKNLLVHMRRHNMTDQTPPTHVYSCVLCRYVNPRRRNLFQHMRKKHNIDISTQVDIAGMTEEEEAAARQDGEKMEFIQTEQGVFTQASTEELTTSHFENAEGSSQVLKDNLAGVANMIKIEDLTRGVSAGVDGKDTSLVIDSSDMTQVIQATSLMQHKAADAIEGLQALAGQAGLIIDEEVSSFDKQPRIVIEQTEGEVLNTTDASLADGSIILAADQSIVEEQVAIDETSSEQIQHIVESVESSDPNAGMTSLELTEEQLSSLHHGDIVQMEGQVYMVEIAQDPESPDKQLLSFLPINQS